MATFSLNTSIAISGSVAQSLSSSYTVPAGSYFQGQVSITGSSGAIVVVNVAGVQAARLSYFGGGTSDSPNVVITAGPGQVISQSGSSGGGSATLTGCVFINTP